MTPYRIIWADDEVDKIVTSEDEKNWKERFGIEIVDKAHTGSELRDKMKSKIYLLDAVIVDANFDEYESSPQEEKIISGLRCAFDLNRIYNDEGKKGIPFFLYTGRNREFLFENCESADQKKLKTLFEDKERWFEKSRQNMLAIMFEKIKKDVDEERSEEGILRRRFAKEFKAAELIEDGQKWLMQALMFEFDITGEYRNTENYFNAARQIWEQVYDGCKKQKFLPPALTLNGTANYLAMKRTGCYTPEIKLMPSTLAHSLQFFLDITQDGSHKDSDLKLGVIDYVNAEKNVNLYRTIVYIAMDLLLWYQKLSSNPPQGSLWKSEYEYEGCISVYKRNNRDRYFLDSYEISPKQNVELKDGLLIGIKKSAEHNSKFTTPNGILVNKFVAAANYDLL